MNQFEALDKIMKIQKHLEDGKIGTAMLEIGMNDEQFPEGLPLEELAQAFSVRLSDLMKTAGVKA